MWSCHTDLIVSLLMNMCWVTEWQTLYHMNPFSTLREYAILYNTNSVCVCVCVCVQVQLRYVFQQPNLLEYLVVWHINLPTADQIALAIPHHSQALCCIIAVLQVATCKASVYNKFSCSVMHALWCAWMYNNV